MTTFAQEMAVTPPDVWLRLGEGSGAPQDSSSNANHGTWVNTPTYGVTGMVTGDSDTCVTTSGTQYITVPNIAAYRPGTGDYAIMLIAKQTMTGVGFLFELATGFTIRLYADGDRYVTDWNGGGTQATSARYDQSPHNNVRHVITLTARRSGNLTIKLNDSATGATPVDISANAATNAQPTGTMQVLRRNSGNPATGTWDEFAYWAGVIPSDAQFTTIVDRILNGPVSDGVTGDAAVSVAPSASATGTPVVAGTAAASVAPSVAASGDSAITGTAAASVAPVASATGSGVVAGTSAVSVAPSAAATGTPVVAGTAAVSVQPSVAGSGEPVDLEPVTGDAAVSVAVSAAATGSPVVRGQASASVAAIVASTGSGIVTGSGAVAIPAVMAAALGTSVVAGTGAVSVTVGVSGSGAPPFDWEHATGVVSLGARAVGMVTVAGSDAGVVTTSARQHGVVTT